MTDETTAPTVEKLLPAHIRDWVYAVLLIINGMLIPAYAIYDLPGWVGIIWGGVNGAGFYMARANTP